MPGGAAPGGEYASVQGDFIHHGLETGHAHRRQGKIKYWQNGQPVKGASPMAVAAHAVDEPPGQECRHGHRGLPQQPGPEPVPLRWVHGVALADVAATRLGLPVFSFFSQVTSKSCLYFSRFMLPLLCAGYALAPLRSWKISSMAASRAPSWFQAPLFT